MTRRFRRRPSGRSLFLALLFIAVGIRYVWDLVQAHPGPSDPLIEGPCKIVRIVDGDTLVVQQSTASNGPTARLRLLGIDCPESGRDGRPSEFCSAAATKFTRRFVAGGQVELRLDRRRLDRYQRYLAYVFVADRMLNVELVRAGLARVSHYPGDSPSIAKQLHRAELEARQSRRGLWSDLAAT